jgi:hypothetical protein
MTAPTDLASTDRDTINAWMDRLAFRSYLLEPLADLLRTVRDDQAARQAYARRAWALLDDAELLLPGVSDGLLDVLNRYAGEGER